MRSVLVVGLIVGSTGCNGGPETSAYEPANLERAAVAIVDQDGEFEGVRRDWVGRIAVDGSGQDFTVTVSTTSGNDDITVHSPAHSDLSGLDGLEDVEVSVAPEPISDELSLSIVDSAGALVYLIEPVEGGILTVDQFGQGLIASGADLGTVSVETFDVEFASAQFRTDTGDVELMPGEPQEVVLDGVSYRVVLLASYTSVNTASEDSRCTGAEARIAFELLRIEAGTADLTPIVRAEGSELPLSECTAAP